MLLSCILLQLIKRRITPMLLSCVLLQLIKRRITPIIERQLGDSQMGFRKGKGTRDAIYQLRMVSEKSVQMGKNLYMCFVDYQKAFDRVKHDKLLKVM